ncbi:hypothetical protein KQ302_07860 [Synechococcus sp. CS-602]|uniref:hypothetical protein n=1 Tax=Synechococcaceae TaxID=1890426 RepID=UPI0008FF4977|nr:MULTISPECIES: hypothetical protein [Synechococcaceae]MCT4363285.1 hypothetical protein [Candidatus Regnicoccus frigidus MAG-AL1]APD47146.1 hypothetical protein BM449_00950 [Synechococcus sp. SynAce01]MCT0202026.1 hypothetical protein [Synechococcus sp. CS-603]MCT0205010.1 hypothetical protein [Synechococcus sp. CS-602]MCT0246214.1 hypothetical protein [Synechococcus sp. CS-601]
MILIKISNPSSVVASRIGRFFAKLTPSGFDQNKVEEAFIKQLVEQMAAQGIQGEVASVEGIDLYNKTIKIEEKIQIGRYRMI